MVSKGRKFEDEIKDLESIVNQIDSGELTLEESISAFERGVALVKSLNSRLEEMQRKVELLSRNAEGRLETSPLGIDLNDKTRSRDDDGEDPPA